jgi:hypothetical protein
MPLRGHRLPAPRYVVNGSSIISTQLKLFPQVSSTGPSSTIDMDEQLEVMSTMFSSTTARCSGRRTSNAISAHRNREDIRPPPTEVRPVRSISPIIIDSPSPTPTPTHTASVPSEHPEVQIIDVDAMPSDPTDFDALDLEPVMPALRFSLFSYSFALSIDIRI